MRANAPAGTRESDEVAYALGDEITFKIGDEVTAGGLGALPSRYTVCCTQEKHRR